MARVAFVWYFMFFAFLLTFGAYPQQPPGLPSGLAPAGVDRNFCRQWSLQKWNVSPLRSAWALISCSGTHGVRLRLDAEHQIVPGFDERLSTLSLEMLGQLAGVNASTGETVQHGLAVSAIDG